MIQKHRGREGREAGRQGGREEGQGRGGKRERITSILIIFSIEFECARTVG